MANYQSVERYRPRTGRLLDESNNIVNEADYLKAVTEGLTPYNETRTAERTIVFSLSGIYPLSIFRDVVMAGTVTHLPAQAEYQVNPASILDTAEHGVYVPGYGGNAGFGVRHDEGAEGDWGYFDSSNGFFFRDTAANGLQVVRRKNSTDFPVDRVDWNVDRLDGNGPSGIDFDPEAGYIFEVDFTFYGYGAILFKIIDKGTGIVGKPPTTHVVHVLNVPNGTTTANPNLPIRVQNTGGSGNFYVSGRQFSVIGKYLPERRSKGITSQLTSVGTDWTHLVSFRENPAKSNFYKIRTNSIYIENSGNSLIEYQLVLNATLGTENPILPDNVSADETAIQFTTDTTTITGGEHMYSGILAGGRNADSSSEEENFKEVIPQNYWVSLIARTVSGSADVTAHLKAIEEW